MRRLRGEGRVMDILNAVEEILGLLTKCRFRGGEDMGREGG